MWRAVVVLALLAGPALAGTDQRALLEGLVGRPEAEVIRRLGPPTDRKVTLDGERLFYQTIDAGRFGATAGQGARDDSGNTGLSLRDYSFRCQVEVVIRDGRMAAFNRTGNDCH